MNQSDLLKRKGFKYAFSSSFNSKRKRGVAILISGMNYKHISEISNEEGRFVRVTGRMERSEITILHVYSPPGTHRVSYTIDLMVDSQGTAVCGGTSISDLTHPNLLIKLAHS